MNIKNSFKRFIGILFVSITFLLPLIPVYAKTLTINEISTEFNNTDSIKALQNLGINITSTIDSTNNKFNVISNNENMFSFDYNTESILYSDPDTEITSQVASDSLFDFVWVNSLLEAIITLSGYEDYTIELEETTIDNYDEYGIRLITESYNFSGEDEGGTWSLRGEYLRDFKVSLDTEKIDALVSKYGKKVEKNENVLETLIPSIEAKDITENSVTIYPTISDSSNSLMCDVYRSTSENGTYEKISQASVNCSGAVGLTDENLSSNTTYYYKAIVVGASNYSNTISVTTKSSSIANNNTKKDNETIENPNTGILVPITTILALIIIGIVSLIYSKKKTSIKHI